MKVARPVLNGGKFAKIYLSWLDTTGIEWNVYFNTNEDDDTTIESNNTNDDDTTIVENNPPKGSPNNSNDTNKKGYVKIDGRPVLMTKEEFLALIEECKQKAKEDLLNNVYSKDFLVSLRLLLNGLFQADGCWTCFFYSSTSHKVTPKFALSQNASIESINLFCMLWAILGCKLMFDISTTSTQNFHIQLRSTNWNYILNTLIPYFSLSYGDKYTAGLKLIRIAELMKLNTNEAKLEAICLAYGLTTDGKVRLVSLKEKLTLCIDESKFDLSTSNLSAMFNSFNCAYGDNLEPLHLLFIYGYFLGDGSLYIRIREVKDGLRFVPKLEIVQKNTPSTLKLAEKIKKFFQDIDIPANIYIDSYYANILIEGIDSICFKLLPLLEKYKSFFFWKKFNLNMTNQFGKLIAVDSRNLLIIKRLILETIYSIENKRDHSLEYWLNKIEEFLKNKANKNITGEFYITTLKKKGIHVGWTVHLPEFFNNIPRNKHFYFKNYKDRDEALKAAVVWRNDAMNKWLKAQGIDIKV